MRRAVFSILILLASVGLCAGGPGYSSSFFYTLSAGTITSSGVITGSNFVSTVATGTAPFASTSTTLCTNLNADSLEGKNSTDFLWLDGTKIMTAGIQFEGATSDTYQTTLTVTDPTAIDKTITLPNATGTVPLLEIGNLFTANQVAPYWRSSVTYNADDPRPYGWPQTAETLSLDQEFNAGSGTGTFTWRAIGGGAGSITDSLATYKGYLTLSGGGSATENFGYLAKLSEAQKLTGDFDIVAKVSSAITATGRVGIAVANTDGTVGKGAFTYNIGSQHGAYAFSWAAGTWPTPGSLVSLSDYEHYTYLRVVRVSGATAIMCSQDTIAWNYITGFTGDTTTYYYIAIYCKLPTTYAPENPVEAVDWIRVK